jgi:hypothetical protein
MRSLVAFTFLLLAACAPYPARQPVPAETASTQCRLQEATQAVAVTAKALASAEAAYKANPNEDTAFALKLAGADRVAAEADFQYIQMSNVRQGPNSAFKPNSFRSTNSMAGKSCHAVCSATRAGLT